MAASEYLNDLLNAAGLPHRVLHARQDTEEAEIIAQAGQEGRITVATNSATDDLSLTSAETDTASMPSSFRESAAF